MPWTFNPAAESPEYSGEVSSCPRPLRWFQLPGTLLANAGRIHPKPGAQGIKHQLKFIARCLATPQLTQNWFQLWQTPKLAPLAASHPRVLLKVQRPYLYQGLD